ncbi:MAG: helix-turn-helix domain-containing protein [Motilibacteraceae bacterium]
MTGLGPGGPPGGGQGGAGGSREDGALLPGLAAALLGRLPVLAERAVRALQTEVAAYRGPQAPAREELLRAVTPVLGRMLQVLAGTVPDGVDPREDARALGRRQAVQVVPAEALQRLTSLLGEVLWQGLVERSAREVDPAQAPSALVAAAGPVWTTVGAFAAAAADAHQQVQHDLGRREERGRARALEVLLAGPGRGRSLGQAARTLGLPERGRYVVVVADAADSAAARRARVEALAALRLGSVWVPRPEGEVGLVVLDGHGAQGVVEALTPVLPGRAAVSPATAGLPSVALAHRLAHAVHATLPEGERQVVLVDERMPEALVSAAPELSDRLVEAVLGPVLALPGPERDVLVATLEQWLAVDGSAAAAAERLYCHRNTVLNRLHRFEGLTGRSLLRTRDVVTVALALAALRQRPAGEGTTVVLPGEVAVGRAHALYSA